MAKVTVSMLSQRQVVLIRGVIVANFETSDEAYEARDLIQDALGEEHEDGYSKGHADGYDMGYDEGHERGFGDGYDKGVTDGSAG